MCHLWWPKPGGWLRLHMEGAFSQAVLWDETPGVKGHSWASLSGAFTACQNWAIWGQATSFWSISLLCSLVGFFFMMTCYSEVKIASFFYSIVFYRILKVKWSVFCGATLWVRSELAFFYYLLLSSVFFFLKHSVEYWIYIAAYLLQDAEVASSGYRSLSEFPESSHSILHLPEAVCTYTLYLQLHGILC